jgi:hypothetical protein
MANPFQIMRAWGRQREAINTAVWLGLTIRLCIRTRTGWGE